MRQIPKLEELIAKGHMKKMTGRGPKNRDIDQALYNWYCERQDNVDSQLKSFPNQELHEPNSKLKLSTQMVAALFCEKVL